MKEKRKVFTTNAILLALLQDMCKKTGKVSKEDFIDEAVDLLSDEFSDEGSARNTVLQYHLQQLIKSGDVKVELEDGKEMLYLVKKYPLTIAKIVPFRGLAVLTVLVFILFAFSLFWTILTKEWMLMIVCGIMFFATITALIAYERCLIVKSRKL
jgi:hypothetical protein